MTIDASAFDAATIDPARNLLVIAPPGCGKTELLAGRAELLLASLRSGQRILALTFSNKAKANLNSRLVKVLGAERKRRYITVRNFHGHAAEVIRSHGGTLAIDVDFDVPTVQTLPANLAPHLERLDEKAARELTELVTHELRVAKQRPLSDENLLRALGSTHPVTQQVEKGRQTSGVLFFEDLLRHAQRLLRIPQIAHLHHCHYGAVLVDEYQDLSPQQLDIALRTCDASRTFVGDPLQGIYSWTGARPVQVEDLLRRISGEPRGLGVSYRSSPRVLEALGAVSVQLGGQPLKSHEPMAWFEGGIAAGGAFTTGVEEARFIYDTSTAILDRHPEATIGVISRSGWRRKPIDDLFTDTGTPCTRWDEPVEDPRVLDLISNAVIALGPAADADRLRARLLATIDLTETETIADVFAAVTELDELAASQGVSIAVALERARVQNESSATIAAGIHLLNAHKGKGQQFDWVFIPGFEDGHIPSFLARWAAQREEEHRVLLVMLSRARHGVVLTLARSLISKKGDPYPTKRSRWVSDFDGRQIDGIAELAAHIERLPRPRD